MQIVQINKVNGINARSGDRQIGMHVLHPKKIIEDPIVNKNNVEKSKFETCGISCAANGSCS